MEDRRCKLGLQGRRELVRLIEQIAGEAGELVAILHWAKENQQLTEDQRAAVTDEIADVMIYLVRLADVSGIDAVQAAHDKVTRNERRFPAA
jgi:dCTP diphosphatase